MRGLTRRACQTGMKCLAGKAGEQAIALARKHRDDVVLLDLMMPKFSGFELCQAFHALT